MISYPYGSQHARAAHRCSPEHFVWTGEYVDSEVTDWWCPTEQRMTMCPGPCPDGTPHGPPVSRTVKSQRLVHLSQGSERTTQP